MEALKGFIRIGIFIGGGGLILLLLEPRDSPQWVLSLCSALLGGLLTLLAMIALRVFRRE